MNKIEISDQRVHAEGWNEEAYGSPVGPAPFGCGDCSFPPSKYMPPENVTGLNGHRDGGRGRKAWNQAEVLAEGAGLAKCVRVTCLSEIPGQD